MDDKYIVNGANRFPPGLSPHKQLMVTHDGAKSSKKDGRLALFLRLFDKNTNPINVHGRRKEQNFCVTVKQTTAEVPVYYKSCKRSFL